MRKSTFLTLFAAAAIMGACSKAPQEPALRAGTVWQNGQEVYIVEDSTSFWQLYGGTLHEGGFEMKLCKDGKWLVPVIADNKPTDSVAGSWQIDADTITLVAGGKTAQRLCLVPGLTVAKRADMPKKALPALDSIQQVRVFAQLEGTYTDNNRKKWVFQSNTLRRMGLSAVEKYAVGKSLDMNDSVIFTANIAYAYTVSADGLLLYKAKYNDEVGAWEYDKTKEKPVFALKRVQR